jgi:hypothetical protein
MDSQDFNTGEYRICAIELEDGKGHRTSLYEREVFVRREPTEFWFWEPFLIRVEYECLLPTIPEFSCGVGCALTSAGTMEHAMYFNTNRPHSDEELTHYHEAEFRQFRGRRGVVCGTIHRLQVKPSNYLLTVAIVSNRPDDPDIYEIHYLRYPIRVSSSKEFPAMFYPNVRFTHGPLETLVTPTMLQAAQEVAGRHLPSGVMFDEQVLAELYLAMKRAGAD